MEKENSFAMEILKELSQQNKLQSFKRQTEKKSNRKKCCIPNNRRQ